MDEENNAKQTSLKPGMSGLKKIVVIGPESTGKSTLCALLAVHYDTVWCPEYAREYLLTHGIQYTYDDLLTIAKGQLDLEDEYIELKVKSEELKVNEEIEMGFITINYKLSQSDPLGQTTNSPLLFIDTDMYVMKVWSEYVFKKCHPFILEQIALREYDLYLLCDIDLPWEEDVLREYPDVERRIELYGIYKSILTHQNTPWAEISGSYAERIQKATQAVDSFLSR